MDARVGGSEGSDADGVIKAIDYLLNINRGYRVPLGGKVVVIGGGLVAIDAARTAVRALVPGLVMSEEEEQSVAAGTMRVALLLLSWRLTYPPEYIPDPEVAAAAAIATVAHSNPNHDPVGGASSALSAKNEFRFQAQSCPML